MVVGAALALAVTGCFVANLMAQAQVGGAGAAPFKVGVVNIDAVFAKYEKAKTYKKELDDTIAPFKGEAEKLKKQINDIVEYFKSPGADKTKNWTVGDHVQETDLTVHVIIISDEKDPNSRASCGNFF